VVTICTTSLTFTNSTFWSHNEFVCFVWISEQTAITSLNSIDCPVFITDTECVYCAVRPGPLNINQVNYSNNSTFCPTQCIYVFCVDLRTNSDYFPIQHYLTGLCNRDGVCLLRGMKGTLKRKIQVYLSLPLFCLKVPKLCLLVLLIGVL
jgi:hypothetical protein